MSNTEPWTLDHKPHILIQAEARPGPPDGEGRQWVERRLTGIGVALCSCGYTTGLIPREQLPDSRQFAREHPPFGYVDGPSTEGDDRP